MLIKREAKLTGVHDKLTLGAGMGRRYAGYISDCSVRTSDLLFQKLLVRTGTLEKEKTTHSTKRKGVLIRFSSKMILPF